VVDGPNTLRSKASQDLLSTRPETTTNEQHGIDLQSASPEVMDILARIKAAKVDSALPTEARRMSSSGASGRGIIIDPYLSQLPPARPTVRSESYRSMRSSAEVASQNGQALVSPTKFDEIAELEYMYGLLKPKVKHSAKPANIEKVQKTIAAGQIRQKLPVGMRVGRTNSGTKSVRSHGRSNSAIEEWRQRNAIPDLSSAPETVERRQSTDEQKISTVTKASGEGKSGLSRQPSSSTRSQRAQGRTLESLATPLTLASRKSYDMLRPDGPSARPSYASHDNGTTLTPEKQRLMKALAMRRRQLGAASRRTTADTQSELLLSAEPDHGMSSTITNVVVTAPEGNPPSALGKQSVSDVPPMLSPVDLGDATDKLFSQGLGEDSGDESTPHLTLSRASDEEINLPNPEEISSSDGLQENSHKIGIPLEYAHHVEVGDRESSLFSNKHLAVGSPGHATSLSGSKRNSPRAHSRRTSYNTQGEVGDGEFDDGLSPSDSLMEELRMATVQEAKQVTATHTTSPKIIAKEGPNAVSSPLQFPTASTPVSADEVKASPVDSILTAYPFPRALATVTEASSPESSRHATPTQAPRVTDYPKEPAATTSKLQTRDRPRTRRDNSTSWLSISRTTTEDSVSEDQKCDGTSFTSHESPSTPPPKHMSRNPRGNSRLPEIHPNSRAQSTFAQPRPYQNHDQGRSATMASEASPVKRTPSLSLFTRHRERRNQSSTDLPNDSSSPTMKSPNSARSPRSHYGRDSMSSISTVNQQQYMKSDLIHATPTPTAGRRSSETSHFSRFHSRASSIISLDPVNEETQQQRGSWAMRSLKRMSGWSVSSRNSLTKLGEQWGEQCATENGVGGGPVSKIPEIAKSGGNLNAVNVPAVVTQLESQLPIVMGELNCLLPDSLVSRGMVMPRDLANADATQLWKRKWVEIVTGNYLVLSGMSVQERAKTQPNRWHLSSFRPPYAIGADREELPYSEFVVI
jgi:hypothetical protein